MATQNRLSQSSLTFGNYLGKPNDLRISKVLSTADGDKIRVLITDDRTMMLAQEGRRRADDLDIIATVIADNVVMNFDANDAKQAWEFAKKIGSAIWDAVGGLIGGGDDGGGGGGGGNCPPLQITAPIVSGSGNTVGNINICVQDCGNAPPPQRQ